MKPDETNPLKHPFPHAKLRNVRLTAVSRLSKGPWPLGPESDGHWLIDNDDPRNYPISRAAACADAYAAAAARRRRKRIPRCSGSKL